MSSRADSVGIRLLVARQNPGASSRPGYAGRSECARRRSADVCVAPAYASLSTILPHDAECEQKARPRLPHVVHRANARACTDYSMAAARGVGPYDVALGRQLAGAMARREAALFGLITGVIMVGWVARQRDVRCWNMRSTLAATSLRLRVIVIRREITFAVD